MRPFFSRLLCVSLGLFSLAPGQGLAKSKGKSKAKEVEESSQGPSWRGPYGMAGCGWGGVAVGNNPSVIAQLGAVMLNFISTNQMSALTSGTSNCDKSSSELASIEQEVFVSSNLASLTIESARGEGEHLVAFAELLGCSDYFDVFARLCQENHQSLFEDGNAKALLTRLRERVRQQTDLSCLRV